MSANENLLAVIDGVLKALYDATGDTQTYSLDLLGERTAAAFSKMRQENERLLSRLAAYEDVVNAAMWLRDSGYDGPFMGEAVEPLFQALRALDGKKCTCGSGAHPRRCNLHPDAYEKHITELEGEEP